jgi:glycosyltransferase involved in cell wall biosynthesis
VGCGVNILTHKDLLSFVVRSHLVRILLDYRPALRERTGVGEFVHQLTKALSSDRLQQDRGNQIAAFTSSWKDRPAVSLKNELGGVEIIDRRIPVRLLTWAWHRVEFPPIEWLAGAADVVHSFTPLLVPSRDAAQVVTVHDLDFLKRPDRARAESRRDFPAFVHNHAQRADQIVVPSHYTANEVVQQLGVPRNRLSVCSPGAPPWSSEVARQRAATGPGSTILFVGTVEARKNVSGLLNAYATLRSRRADLPPLVIAGHVTPNSLGLVERAKHGPLAGLVEFRGYVGDTDRPALYRDARMLVLPSFEEGFGLPVLEAMACGVPVVISDRGSLPEVAGSAATPVAPDDTEGLAGQMERLLETDTAAAAVSRGLAQAVKYSWESCALSALEAYREARHHRVGA